MKIKRKNGNYVLTNKNGYARGTKTKNGVSVMFRDFRGHWHKKENVKDKKEFKKLALKLLLENSFEVENIKPMNFGKTIKETALDREIRAKRYLEYSRNAKKHIENYRKRTSPDYQELTPAQQRKQEILKMAEKYVNKKDNQNSNL